MKYGIQAVYSDGSLSFCSSTRYKSFTCDSDDIALFVQEESAVKAIKEFRKADYEIDNDCVLSVIAVELVVKEVKSVPYPPKKTGYVISGVKWNQHHQQDYTVYFGGPKKQGSDVLWTESWNSATFFADEFSAQQRINDSKQKAIEHVAYREKEAQDYSYRAKHYYRDSEAEQKRREQYNQDEIQRAKEAVEWHDHLTIEHITR